MFFQIACMEATVKIVFAAIPLEASLFPTLILEDSRAGFDSMANTERDLYTTYFEHVSTSAPSLDTTLTKRVSPGVTGPASISYGFSVTYSRGYSISLNGAEISLINLSIGYSDSVSTNQNFGVSFPVAAGQVKAVYFTPRVVRQTGYIKKVLNTTGQVVESKWVEIVTPQKVGSYADGVYELRNY